MTNYGNYYKYDRTIIIIIIIINIIIKYLLIKLWIVSNWKKAQFYEESDDDFQIEGNGGLSMVSPILFYFRLLAVSYFSFE